MTRGEIAEDRGLMGGNDETKRSHCFLGLEPLEETGVIGALMLL